MRVFLAGASGVIGTRLVPLLAQAGHAVVGMTRSPENLEEAARRTVELLEAPSGVVVVAEEP